MVDEDSTIDSLNLDDKVEAEKLIQMLLLRSEVGGSLSSDPQFADCINKLSHLHLDELAAIPKRIQMEEDSIRHKTEQLAVENYPIFLANANTSRDVHRDFLSISETNANLLSSIAGISSVAQATFDNIGKNASAFRVSAKFVQKYPQILDFLELPQLMDTCIQNGYCQDALNILSHTKGMTKKYGRTVPIVRMVGLQAQEISGQLFSQLCKKLREPITLPVCLKVVIYLRQFEAFTEQELRLTFLQARGICIRDQLKSALAKPIGLFSFDSSSTSKLAHISGHHQAEYRAFIRAMRRIEVTRVHLFDSITQYRAVFADEEAYSSKLTDAHQQPVLADISPLHLDETSSALRGLTSSGIDCLSSSTEASLFHSWLVYQVGVFLDGLSEDISDLLNLPHLTPSEISDRIQLAMANESIALHSVDAPATFQQIHSVMTQALYFGRSFARIGCDFRPHLGIIFSREILTYFETLLMNALTELSVTLEMWPWELSEPPFATNQQECTNSGEISAPVAIAFHPPIAFFCNRLLVAFNGLRICCPVGLRDGVLSASTRTLNNAAETIVAAHKSRQLDSTAARAQSANLASVFTHVAVPHILSCLLEYVFGGDAAAHLWQLHLEGEEDSLSTSQTISSITRQVCAPIFMVWGQLTTGSLITDNTVKQSVIPDTDEARSTSAAHLSPLTTAPKEHQTLEFQDRKAKVLSSLTEESNDLPIVKEEAYSVELSLPQENEVEYESKVVAAYSAGFIPAFEMRKNGTEVLEKEEGNLEVAYSPGNCGFPPNNFPPLESFKHPLSSTGEMINFDANYGHLVSMQKSEPEAVSSTLPASQLGGSSSRLENWPHEGIGKEAASCYLTEPNQEEVVREDVESRLINQRLDSSPAQESETHDYAAPEVAVPPVTKGATKGTQGYRESGAVNGESVVVASLKVVADASAKDHTQFPNNAIDESGQQVIKTHVEIGTIDKLSLDAHRSSEIIKADGNTTAEIQFTNQYSTFSEMKGNQSNHDAVPEPYHSHSPLKENQSSMQEMEMCVQSSSTPHDLASEAPAFGVAVLTMTLTNNSPCDGDLRNVQGPFPPIEGSDSFAASVEEKGPLDDLESSFLKDALLEQPESNPPESPTRSEHVFRKPQGRASTPFGQRGLGIRKNQELSPSTMGSNASLNCECINPSSIEISESGVDNYCTLDPHDNGNNLKTPTTASVTLMVTSSPTPVLGVSDKVNEPAAWNDEMSGGNDINLICHLKTARKVCDSTVSDAGAIDIQANHQSLFPMCDQIKFHSHGSATPVSGKEEGAGNDDSILFPSLGSDNAGELSASAASSVPVVISACPTSTLEHSNTDRGHANWVAGGYALGKLGDDRHVEPVNINNRNIGDFEEFVTSKGDKVFVNVDASIVNKTKETETSGTVAADVQLSLVERAVHSGSLEGPSEVDNGNAWFKDGEVSVDELAKQVDLCSPDFNPSMESVLNEGNAEKQLSADAGSEVDVKLSGSENIGVAGIRDLAELIVADQNADVISTVGGEFANCEDAWEVDAGNSDFASLPNHGMDVQSIHRHQFFTNKSDLNRIDSSESIRERPEVLEEDTLEKQIPIAFRKPVTELQQTKVDELLSDVSAEGRLAFVGNSDAKDKGSLKANVDWGDYTHIDVSHEEERGVLSKDSNRTITHLATELVQQNNEAAFEPGVKASEANSVIITGADNLVQLPILDRTSGDVGDVGGASADLKGEWEADKDPPNFATIQPVHGLAEVDSHGAGIENANSSRTWENRNDTGQTDEKYCPSFCLISESKPIEPINPHDSEAIENSATIASYRNESADFDKSYGFRNEFENLALLDVNWSDGANLWDEDADADVKDEGRLDLHADDKPTELDSYLVQRNAEGVLGPVRQSRIDFNVSVNEAQDSDVHEDLLVMKKVDAKSFEEEAIEAKVPSPLNEWHTEVEKAEADERHPQGETSSNVGTLAEKRPEAEQSLLMEKPSNKNDLDEDENILGDDGSISVNVVQKHYELGRSKSVSVLTEKAGCEMKGLSTTRIPSAPSFSDANTSESGTTYLLRTVADWQETRLAVEDTVTSIPYIVSESSSAHSEPSEIRIVEADGSKRVDGNWKSSSEGLSEVKPSDAAKSEGWDVDF